MLSLIQCSATGRALDAIWITEMTHDLYHWADIVVGAKRDQCATNRFQPIHQMLNLVIDALIAAAEDLPGMKARKNPFGRAASHDEHLVGLHP